MGSEAPDVERPGAAPPDVGAPPDSEAPPAYKDAVSESEPRPGSVAASAARRG